jgi:4,5-dihydroxyphthalate decarboxylase
MADIQLSLACSDNPRTRPIIEGRVKPDGVDLQVTVLHPSEMFWRQLHFEEFDISEMSLSSLLMTVANGDKRWVGLPVFTSRRFFHTGVLVATDSGIERPEDLKGKRVGVPEYQQTAALWERAALREMYGIKPEDMRWWMERTEERSHGSATGFQPPASIEFHYVPEEKNLGTMLVNGELDACLHYLGSVNLVDRSNLDLNNHPKVRRLFSDPRAEGAAYYRRTGFYPINHGVVVHRRVADAHPWVPLNIYNAFAKAKALVDEGTRSAVAPFVDAGLVEPQAFKEDLFAYGVKANKPILTAIAQFSNEQGLTPRRLALEEIFSPQTLDL